MKFETNRQMFMWTAFYKFWFYLE